MPHRIIALFFPFLLIACQAVTPAGRIPDAPASAVASPLTVMTPNAAHPELGGEWSRGVIDEPAAGPVTCGASGTRLSEAEGTVTLTVEGCGTELALGRYEGDRLRLTGTAKTNKGDVPVDYDLAYDATSEHFRGTRNGAPVWFARNSGGCSSLCTTGVRGTVFHQYGYPVPGVTIQIVSQDPANPFESTITSDTGAYAFGQAPAGATVTITVRKEGWETISRQIRLGSEPLDVAVVDFGSPMTPYVYETGPYALKPKDGSPSFSRRWSIGATDEPPAGGDPRCGTTAQLVVEDGAARLTNGECSASYLDAKGTFDGHSLRLEGTVFDAAGETPVRYELAYDPVSEHFRGTRNGTPCWLARSVAVCPSSVDVCPTLLRGRVYDAAGDPVTGAKVAVRSLNPSNPFESTVDVIHGAYLVNNVPFGVEMEVTVTKAGWVTQTRSKATSAYAVPTWVNFGGPAVAEDPDAPGYALTPQASSATAD